MERNGKKDSKSLYRLYKAKIGKKTLKILNGKKDSTG
jgi:hypothetical protein